MAGLTVLDASVLIADFDEDDVHHPEARRIIRGDSELVANVLTVAESLVRATEVGLGTGQMATIKEAGISVIPLNEDSASQLAFLRAGTGLKMPDVCVLYTGLRTYATAIATRDGRLRAVAADLGFETP